LRKVSLAVGLVLLVSGIVSEAMYITTSNIAYGNTIASSAYLTLGILFIIVGFILTLTSTRIPKIRVP
jgi:hypothetical protein